MTTLGICPPDVAGQRMISLFHPVVPAAAHERVAQVLGSRWLGLGPVTEEFEHVFAKKIGARHAVAVNSGTAALHLALRLLGIGPGDEVILPANTFVATGHVILYEGATPVFADIDPATGNLDPGHLRTVLSPRTAAVIAVHYAGAPCAMAEIRAIAASAGAVVVEDCAHVCGATYAGRPLAASGTFQAYSFHATKVLAVGEGGALVVPTEQDAGRARRLRRLGIGPRQGSGTPTTGWDYGVEEVGLKCNLNDLHAAIGLAQIDVLDEIIEHRGRIAGAYAGRLKHMPGADALGHPHTTSSSNWVMPVTAGNRDQLMADLAAAGVGTGVHFRRIDSYPMYRQADLPGTEWFWRHQLSLPIHMAMTVDDVGYICDAIERSTADAR
jgi:perosamine synthetase